MKRIEHLARGAMALLVASGVALVIILWLVIGSGCSMAVDALQEVAVAEEPLTTWGPPSNWAPGVRAYVGKRSTNSDILLVYQQGLSGGGACSEVEIIGDNGVLFERTRALGTSGNDEMYVAHTGEDVPKAPCGLALAPITTSIKLELYAGAGDDVIQSLTQNSNLVTQGEGGVDFIAVGSAYFAAGGGPAGNVVIATQSESIFSTTIQGGTGNDTMCAYHPATVIGDAGSDQWWAPGSDVFSVETPTNQTACNFWLNAVDARMDD